MANDEIVNVRYMVDDVEASVAFYTGLLGFEVLTNARAGVRRCEAGQPPSAAVGTDRARPVVRCPTAPRPVRGAGTGSTSSSTTSTPRSHGSATPARRFATMSWKGPGGQQILLQDPSGNFVELFQPAHG